MLVGAERLRATAASGSVPAEGRLDVVLVLEPDGRLIQRHLVPRCAADLGAQRCITPAVHQLDSRPMVVAQRLAPLHQSHQDREQLPPSLGQDVLVARSLAGFAIGTAVDEAVCVQLLEPARHHRLAQPGAARELVEPRAAVEQLAEHQHRRARADQLQRPLDAAPAFRGPLVARRERALALQYVGGLLSVGHVIHPTSDFAFPKPEAYRSGYGFPKPDAREGPPMTSAYLIDAVRTPVAKGKPGGAYSDSTPWTCTPTRWPRSWSGLASIRPRSTT